MILPEKQSKLLRLAVKDAQKIAQSNFYVLNMEQWHTPRINGSCEVCMAGAVIARTLNGDRGKLLAPDCFDPKVNAKLSRINAMRMGAFCGESEAEHEAGVMIRDSKSSNFGGPKHMRADWEVYLKAADILEKAGL